jgi:hypothetical protein
VCHIYRLGDVHVACADFEWEGTRAVPIAAAQLVSAPVASTTVTAIGGSSAMPLEDYLDAVDASPAPWAQAAPPWWPATMDSWDAW